MQKKKTVILWGRDDVLSQAIEIFLAAKSEWEVITIRDKQTIDQFQKVVDDLHPKVIIINRGDNKSSDNEKDFPIHLIQKNMGIKVITMSLENNKAEVLNKQQVVIKEICDLLNTVEE